MNPVNNRIDSFNRRRILTTRVKIPERKLKVRRVPLKYFSGIYIQIDTEIVLGLKTTRPSMEFLIKNIQTYLFLYDGEDIYYMCILPV